MVRSGRCQHGAARIDVLDAQSRAVRTGGPEFDMSGNVPDDGHADA